MKEKLIEFLNYRVAECNSTAEELIQECGNAEGADVEFAKAMAFKEVIDFINTTPE